MSLLRQTYEHDLAPGRVTQQLDDLLGLATKWTSSGRVHQPEGAREEGNRVACSRRIKDNQVRRAGTLELLDLAEHKDLSDAGYGGRHYL